MFKIGKYKTLATAAAAMAAAFVPQFATAQSDARILDALVSKGLLEKAEADDLKKGMAEIPVVETPTDTFLRISGKMQSQYEYIYADCTDGAVADSSASVSKFIIRRMILTFNSDNKRDWGTQLSFDFILPNQMSVTYLWKRVDCNFVKGEFRFGYVKPNFCFEENMSPFKLYCVERSVATYYWGGPRKGSARKLGFASFMTGAFWYGESREIRGLKYAFAATNSDNYKVGYESISDGSDNAPNVWASSSYATDIGGVKTTFGLNLGWGSAANKTGRYCATAMYGANPYITLDWGALRTYAEFIITKADGAKCLDGSYDSQLPFGLNYMVEYKFDIGEFGKIGPAFRFSYLDTDGRGVSPSDVIRQSVNVSGDTPYLRVKSFYFGLNWYIRGDNLKVQSGYEYAHFDGGVGGAHGLDVNWFRTQVQVLF